MRLALVMVPKAASFPTAARQPRLKAANIPACRSAPARDGDAGQAALAAAPPAANGGGCGVGLYGLG